MKPMNWKRFAFVVAGLSVMLAVSPAAAADDNHCGLKGTYAYAGFGYTYAGNPLSFPVGYITVTGTVTFDGNGNSVIRQAEDINGVLINANAEYSATYTVKPDCTFTTTLFGITAFGGVVADNGKQIRAMITIPGIQVSFTNTIRVHP